MPALNIDRDSAHDAAQRELGKPIYPKASLTERFTDWLDQLMYRVAAEGANVPGGWFTITVLVILLVVAVVVAVRIARRTMRTSRTAEPLFGAHQFSAAEHRAAAEQCAAAGDWATAIRHRLRAVARQLEDDGVLIPVPGRTASELARDAGSALPQLNAEFADATQAFNDVTYGGRPGSEVGYRLIAGLDDHIRFHVRGSTAGTAAPEPVDGWAQVQ